MISRGKSFLRARWIQRAKPDIAADKQFMAIFAHCREHTMTSIERMYGLYQAVRYVSLQNISGDFVECGVWRGGSSMVCALTLAALGDTQRRLYLYDTFEGMSAPTAKDLDLQGRTVDEILKERKIPQVGDWCNASLNHVKAAMATTGYPADRVTYVQGKVEDTIPAVLPERIALLRLDTDWYESTYHELTHLYPRLAPHAPLIIDDYGHWQGAREATDQYFAENGVRMLLNRLDYTGRIGIKA